MLMKMFVHAKESMLNPKKIFSFKMFLTSILRIPLNLYLHSWSKLIMIYNMFMTLHQANGCTHLYLFSEQLC